MSRITFLIHHLRPGVLTLLGTLLVALAACDDGPTPPAAVASVEVAPGTLTLQLEETRQLSATAKAANGQPLSDRPITWASRDTAVATVSASGMIQARGGGSTTITATGEGRSGSATVTVNNPAPSISGISPESAVAGSGATTLTVIGQAFVPGARVLWNSVPLSTTRVSATEMRAEVGAAALANEGSAQITVENPLPGGGASSALAFTIALMPVASVALSPQELSLFAGEEATLQASVQGADGRILSGRVVSWASNDPLTAEVDESGKVTARREGATSILAVSEGLVGSAVVRVNPARVASVTISPPTLSLGEGEQATLEATLKGVDGQVLTGRVIAWTSSDATTAVVDATGKVSTHKPGTARIFAASEGQLGSAEVTVLPAPVASVTLSRSALALEPGSSQQLVATLRDAGGRVLTGRGIQWRSSAAGVASVTDAGMVSAHALGSATITVESEGRSASASVMVEAGPAADLIYNSIAAGDRRELFVLDLRAPGTPPSRVDAGTTSRDPTVSPDGNRIAFVRETTDPTTQEARTDIWAVNRDGTNLRRLTTLSGVSDDPAWSPVPGANRIAFRHWSSETRRSDLWVMDADGANPRNLTGELPDGALRHSPAWSPDGQWIAFADGRAAGNVQSLWIMRADGTQARQLTGGMMTFISHPSWSPDGQRIAFSRFSSGDADITIIDLNGGALQHFGMPGHQRAPAWSPDGRHIAFSHQTGSSYEIHTIRPDGTDRRLRTPTSASGGENPAWIRRP